MKARIASFRRSRTRTYDRQMILYVDGVDSREDAEELVGKKVQWKAPGKEEKTIKGEVSSPHGNSGAVRAIFERGMPGQSLGAAVELK